MLTDTEARDIRAILDLKARGWTEPDIRRVLRFSERTFRRRLTKAEEFRRRQRSQAVTPVLVAC